MKLGFCLFKYFPYGGLQKDFMDVAQRCHADGHQVTVYTTGWQGDMPTGFQVHVIKNRAWSSHRKYQKFHQRMRHLSAMYKQDCLVGFNKMPGLDVYFASDPCYKAKSHHPFARLGARYRHFMQYEEAVCGPASHTRILFLAPAQQQEYQRAWNIDDSRFNLLPPGISRSAMADENAVAHRQQVRAEFGIKADEYLLLMIGSGFRTKGLDRALLAMAALPALMRNKVRLVVIGEDKADAFDKILRGTGLSTQVKIMRGRDDVAAIMQAGDCLIHPAYREAAGKAILEAVVAGLPVLVTDVCGYAQHVVRADAGYVLPAPFEQQTLNSYLTKVLESNDLRRRWRDNGIVYGQTEDLYQMADIAARIVPRCCRERPGGQPQ